MGEFQELLKTIRKRSHYPLVVDFSRVVRVSKRTFHSYESGRNLPSHEALERIIHNAAVPNNVAATLRELHNETKARRVGIDLTPPLPVKIGIPELAEKIQREVEYELKRMSITMTPRARRVCIRRIGMILNDALRSR